MHKDESEHSHSAMKKQTPPEKMTATTYVGIDVAKATLQVHLNGHQIEFNNNSKGHAQLTKKLAQLTRPHVICDLSRLFICFMAAFRGTQHTARPSRLAFNGQSRGQSQYG